jgi:hypothetical protein
LKTSANYKKAIVWYEPLQRVYNNSFIQAEYRKTVREKYRQQRKKWKDCKSEGLIAEGDIFALSRGSPKRLPHPGLGSAGSGSAGALRRSLPAIAIGPGRVTSR